MATPPTPTNPTATTVNKAIDVLESTIVKVAEGYIIADAPWLGLPIIRIIWEAIFNWVAGKFAEAAKQGATFAIIDHQISTEESALAKALANLELAKKGGNADEIRKAIQAYADANSALIHYDGSAPTH